MVAFSWLVVFIPSTLGEQVSKGTGVDGGGLIRFKVSTLSFH